MQDVGLARHPPVVPVGPVAHPKRPANQLFVDARQVPVAGLNQRFQTLLEFFRDVQITFFQEGRYLDHGPPGLCLPCGKFSRS